MSQTKQDYRKKDLARIHILKKELCLEEDSYRDLLEKLAGKRSAADLDVKERWAVINHMQALSKGETPREGQKRNYPGKPKNMKEPSRKKLLSKIEAMLAEAGRPWAYADGLAKRICKVDKLAWCNPQQLHKIVAALVYDAQRHGRRTS